MRTVIAAATLFALLAAAPSGQGTLKPDELDKLLAPVALYPDPLLAQMLLCAGDPDQVVKLQGWLASNTTFKGTELQDEATVAGFDPSFVALVLFPQVIDQMAKDKAWTTRLGKAFESDRKGVFDSIQRLRQKAQKSGALKDSTQQNVETQTTSSGQQVIVIEPANPQVVYVPQYNPQVVYVEQESSSSDAAVAGLIGFTAGIAIGAAMDNDYYYGPYGWGGGFHMYNEAWDDYYDHREDAREDWMEHREELSEERGDRAGNRQEQRTERTDSRQSTRSDTQAQRTERTQTRSTGTSTAAASQPRTSTASSQPRSTGTTQARGYSQPQTATQSSGTRSDAFSGYSNGKTERAASARGQSSRSSSARSGGARSGGGGGRRR
jgi:hypothetical protein